MFKENIGLAKYIARNYFIRYEEFLNYEDLEDLKQEAIIELFSGKNVFLNTVTETGENASSLTDEKRLKELLEKIDKIGSVEVMITYGKESGFYETNQAEIAGIVVICRKECDSESVLLIHEVIQALFPVSAHKIKVVKGISS